MRNTWTKTEADTAEELFQGGMSINEISDVMGRTEPSVRNKLTRMGLIARPTLRPRVCQVCQNQFYSPLGPSSLSDEEDFLTHCSQCRRIRRDAEIGNLAQNEMPTPHRLAAPMKQVVFDLETWGLDRGWGVTMVASFLIHGGQNGPEKKTLLLRDYPSWQKGIRSNDKDMVKDIFEILKPCHIAYAHNGERFDIRWLRSVALKYNLEMPKLKLVDPCAIAWRKYRLGRNSLEALADFLELGKDKGKEKMHVSPDTWRGALMDDDDECWRILGERCESDVDLLNEVAARVTGDVGMVDYYGSTR